MRRRVGFGFRIAVGYLAAIALLGVVGAVGAFDLRDMRARAAEQAAFASISALVRDTVGHAAQLDVATRGVALGDFSEAGSVQNAEAALTHDLERLAASDDTKDISVNRVEQIVVQGEQIGTDVRALRANVDAERGNKKGAVAASAATLTKLNADAALLYDFTAKGDASAKAAFDAARRKVEFVFVAGILAVVVLAALIALSLGRSLARRLGRVTAALTGVAEDDVPQLVEAFERLSRGDLNASFGSAHAGLNDRGSDEIRELSDGYDHVAAGLGRVGDAFDEMAGTLRDAVGQVLGAVMETTRLAATRTAAPPKAHCQPCTIEGSDFGSSGFASAALLVWLTATVVRTASPSAPPTCCDVLKSPDASP